MTKKARPPKKALTKLLKESVKAPEADAPKILAGMKTLSIPAWLYLVGFVVVVALVGVGGWLITRGDTQSALPYKPPEVKGRVTEKQRQEDSFGWGSELMIDKQVGMPASIRFMLRDVDRKPIKDADISITFIRLARDVKPLTTSLNMVEPGVYRGIASLPKGGAWEAYVAVKSDKTSYQVTKTFILPETPEKKAE